MHFCKSAVPTFLDKAAHEKGRTLDSIRRELCYFRPDTRGNIWTWGSITLYRPLSPDEWPSKIDPSKGIVVIGSTRWMDN